MGVVAGAAIDVIEVTGGQRDKLLNIQEGHFLDLKAIEVSTKKLGVAITAFANAAGGDLYIGLKEEKILGVMFRHWHGFKDVEAGNGHIQSLEALFPLGAEYSYEYLCAAGSSGLVLHIQVQRTPQIARAHNKKIYIRRAAQNLEVKGEAAIERLRLDKGIESFEKQTVDAELDLISESDVIAEFTKAVVPSVEPIRFLKKQSLIKNGRPVVASVLLFADEPQAVLPKRSGVKIYRYKTTKEAARETLDGIPLTIEGHLYDLISKSVKATVKMVEFIRKLGPKGLEKVQYPYETLHEILTNAILHRDYSIATDVQIRIFDNRIEVESPGLFPGHVTASNLLDEQFARNGAIVRLINKFPNPPNKDVGEGLNTAFKAMQKLRLKPPIIKENQTSVLVTIKHEALASPEESVMDYLENHETIKNGLARELTGIESENTMKEVFYRLAKRGLIERVPELKGAAAAWQKKTTTFPTV